MKDSEITVNEALALVGRLNGLKTARAVLRGTKFDPLEHSDITLGQAIAVVSKLGGKRIFVGYFPHTSWKSSGAWKKVLA